MAALDPLFVAKDSSGRGVSPRDARLAIGGLLTSQGAGLDIRTGILNGLTVTPSSATGPMQVSVAAGQWVALRQDSDGPEIGPNDGPTPVDIATAPASNARIDLVWVKSYDAERDSGTYSEFGVTEGAVSATPTGDYASVPAGALVLAEVRVAAGAVRTTDPQVTITQVAQRTVARGGVLPVRTQAEQDALTPYAYDGMVVARLDTGVLERRHQGAWGPLAGTPPFLHVKRTGAQTVPATPTFSTIVLNTSVTSQGTGLTVGDPNVIIAKAGLYTVSARAQVSQRFDMRLVQNGVEVSTFYASGGAWPAGSVATLATVIKAAANDTIAVQVSPAGTADILEAGCDMRIARIG